MWLVALSILLGFTLVAWVLGKGLADIAWQVRLIARLSAGDSVAKQEAIGDGGLA